MVYTDGEPGDPGWGDYNEYGVKEVGNASLGQYQMNWIV